MYSKTRMIKNSFPDGKTIMTKENHLKNICTSHFHNFYEIDIVLDGEGTSICNGESFDIKRGMVTFLSPEGLHSFENKGILHEINIQFTYDAVNSDLISFISNVKRNVVYIDEKTLDSIYSLFCLLNNADNITNSNDYSSKLLECIILCFKDKFICGTPNEIKPSSSLQNAIIYIHSRFADDPKMWQVAKHLHLNENYFSQMFKKGVGMSYKEYLRKIKLEHAKKLLIYTNSPITKIAYDSGYNSQSHFNRDFKNVYCMSPIEMRKKFS